VRGGQPLADGLWGWPQADGLELGQGQPTAKGAAGSLVGFRQKAPGLGMVGRFAHQDLQLTDGILGAAQSRCGLGHSHPHLGRTTAGRAQAGVGVVGLLETACFQVLLGLIQSRANPGIGPGRLARTHRGCRLALFHQAGCLFDSTQSQEAAGPQPSDPGGHLQGVGALREECQGLLVHLLLDQQGDQLFQGLQAVEAGLQA